MTIKVYKKRVHWYFKYHNIEYAFDRDDLMNTLENLFDKKVFYFRISFTKSLNLAKLGILNYWGDYRLSETSVKLISIGSQMLSDNRIRIPYVISDKLGRYSAYIDDIK